MPGRPEDFRGAMAEQQVRGMVTQLRSLAAADAGEKAILVTLDTLVDLAVEAKHQDLALFQNLRAQALRCRDSVSVAELVSEVLKGKNEDKVSSAVHRLMRDARVKSKKRKSDENEETSPSGKGEQCKQGTQVQPQVASSVVPQIAYPGMPFPVPQASAPMNMGYGMGGNAYGSALPYFPYFSPPFQRRKKPAACFICNEQGHLAKDCQKRFQHNVPAFQQNVPTQGNNQANRPNSF